MVKNLTARGKTALKKVLFALRWRLRPPIFVYQMGKVASSSIYRSLFEQYTWGNTIHGHQFQSSHYYWTVEKLYQYYSPGKPLKIISPVREPIGRNVSAFFHNAYHNPGLKKEPFDLFESSLTELKELFLTHYDHQWPLNWFDNHIKKHFGIDVYRTSFPASGFQTFKEGNTELLVLKHDLANSVKEEAISEFCELDRFRLNSINVGAEKEYASKYREFRENITLPEYYLDEMRNSKYMQHFFTREEIEEAINTWR